MHTISWMVEKITITVQRIYQVVLKPMWLVQQDLPILIFKQFKVKLILKMHNFYVFVISHETIFPIGFDPIGNIIHKMFEN